MKRAIIEKNVGKKIGRGKRLNKYIQLRGFISFLLAMVLLISFTACQKTDDTSDGAKADSDSYEATADGIMTDSASPSRDEAVSDSDISYSEASESFEAVTTTSDDSAASTDSDTIQPDIRPEPQYGQLTAGEWNDNDHYDYFLNVLNNNDWYSMQDYWGFNNWERYTITVTNAEDQGISGATVAFYDEQGEVYYQIMTDHTGLAYAYPLIHQGSGTEMDIRMKVFYKDQVYDFADMVMNAEDNSYDLTINENTVTNNDVDIMFVIDTTGSMSDELDYIKKEIENVVTEVQRQNANNLNIRLSINYYRDVTDEYVVRSYPFTTDIDTVVAQIGNQWADGGGDYEEAVETALMDGITGHDWNIDAKSKLLFLVLDAPPHHNDNTLSSLKDIVTLTSEMGIKIIPVASSGVDKETEFLLRFLSMTSGGTYVFLTNDSGIGGSHIEPTIGEYQVEYLNELLVRLINGYIQ